MKEIPKYATIPLGIVFVVSGLALMAIGASLAAGGNVTIGKAS